jgi:hypothetical protein
MRAARYAQRVNAPTQMPDLLGLSDSEFAEPTETRIQKSLSNPGSPGSLQLGAINKITQARIRWAIAELTALQLEKVDKLFDQLAADSPKAAADFLLELLKFSTPQQKSMTVETAPNGGDNLPQMSLAQLQGLVFRSASDGVVSEQ